MATKIYTLTVEYQESDIGSEVISAPGTPIDGMTRTEASLWRFLNYLKEVNIKQDPSSFSAKITSIVEVE